MSSSSALIVGVARRWCIRRGDLRSSPSGAPTSAAPSTRPAIYACIENGRDVRGARRRRRRRHARRQRGSRGDGLLPQPGARQPFRSCPCDHLRPVRLPPDWGIVVHRAASPPRKPARPRPYNRLARGAASARYLESARTTHSLAWRRAAISSGGGGAPGNACGDGAGRPVAERGTGQPPASLLREDARVAEACRRTRRQRRRPHCKQAADSRPNPDRCSATRSTRPSAARLALEHRRVGLAQLRRRLWRKRLGARRARSESFAHAGSTLPRALPRAAVYSVRRAAGSLIDGIRAVDELSAFEISYYREVQDPAAHVS